ncbi:hypothetical protein L210DRAFT_941779 [Boletus edulis BED1]|uniref:Uncharacterized protein n=1 Tax=Boletus edulis BED1 TaxID=1328754 RepID=A0AAD4GM55_BOLED|nr:hypothetical protein L210DRAFT_941779 [Boletus edulis BED1]
MSTELKRMGNVSLNDGLWIIQKLEAGIIETTSCFYGSAACRPIVPCTNKTSCK